MAPEPAMRDMEDEIDLRELWQTLMAYKWRIMAVTILASIAAVVVSLCMPNIYTADAVIMPTEQKSGGGLSAALSGGVGALLSGSIGGGAGSTKVQLVAVLKSRSLAEQVLNRDKNRILEDLYTDDFDEKSGQFTLQDPKKIPQLPDILQDFSKQMVIGENAKSPTISISISTKNAALSQNIATYYVEELKHYLDTHTLTDSKRNRHFVETSLESKSKELLEAGKELSQFYKTNIISNVGETVDVDAKLLSPSSSPNDPSGVYAVPQQVYLQYLNGKFETLKTTTALLAAEYEKARITENKEELSFQVLDAPLLPSKKSKPKRALIVMGACMAAFFLSSLLSVFHANLKKQAIAPVR